MRAASTGSGTRSSLATSRCLVVLIGASVSKSAMSRENVWIGSQSGPVLRETTFPAALRRDLRPGTLFRGVVVSGVAGRRRIRGVGGRRRCGGRCRRGGRLLAGRLGGRIRVCGWRRFLRRLAASLARLGRVLAVLIGGVLAAVSCSPAERDATRAELAVSSASCGGVRRSRNCRAIWPNGPTERHPSAQRRCRMSTRWLGTRCCR